MVLLLNFATAFLPIFGSTFASPHLNELVVFVPPVTLPKAGTVWEIGTEQVVAWNISNPPESITNSVGQIFLRNSNHTIFEQIAGGFPILKGSHEVTVPVVPPDSNYQIMVFGDSGNLSPPFTITA